MSSRWKSYAVLALVFVLGAAAGGGVVYSVTQRRHASMLDEHELHARRLNALSRKLDLDAEQKTKIEGILDQDREDSKTLLRDHRAEVDQKIRAVLRPDQRTRFDQMVEDRKRHGGGRR
jgi:Spy/CpxP family protein refolding chaperone